MMMYSEDFSKNVFRILYWTYMIMDDYYYTLLINNRQFIGEDSLGQSVIFTHSCSHDLEEK